MALYIKKTCQKKKQTKIFLGSFMCTYAVGFQKGIAHCIFCIRDTRGLELAQ